MTAAADTAGINGRAEPAPDATADPSPGAEALYLFGFVRAGAGDRIPGRAVEGGGEVFGLTYRLVTAVVSRVPVGVFSGPGAADRLSDLSWVGPRACRHEEVVEAAMKRSPVLPARFGTLFSCRERLDALVGDREEEISRFLDQVDGRAEWSLKGLLDEEAALDAATAEAPSVPSRGEGQGAAYLRERGRRVEASRQLGAKVEQAADRLDAALSLLARDLRKLGPLSAEASGRDRPVVYRRAILVDSGDVPVLKETVASLNRSFEPRGLILDLSGPWPPYHFCPSLEHDGGGG